MVKSGVQRPESSGDLIDWQHFNSIFEFDSRNHFCQVIKSADTISTEATGSCGQPDLSHRY